MSRFEEQNACSSNCWLYGGLRRLRMFVAILAIATIFSAEPRNECSTMAQSFG
jgi:hypothetical protein